MGLRDSREGFGLQNSWPAYWPWLSITIDHCLVSRDIRLIDRKVGPDIGSDHYPVLVEVGIQN
jgi:endonuclease/exonuclease/phosphatase family metal-dependent hydrolase